MGENGFGCRLEWEWVGLWLEFYIGQTLQNQSSVMSDTRGYGGIHWDPGFSKFIHDGYMPHSISDIQSYLKWDTRSMIYVSKGKFLWFRDVFSSWVISMLHHWMPTKRMDPSEGSPLSRNTPEVPWWVRGTWNEPLTNLLHNSRDMNNMMRRRCDGGWWGEMESI